MAEQAGGIELMRRRMERARRQAPPPRRAREEASAPAPAGAAEPAREPAEAKPGPGAPAAAGRRPAAAARLRLAPDAAPVNLAIRVRRPLDDRLADLIHELRHSGVRTSKVELVEMLLWELPEQGGAALRSRLARFRDWAPRGPGAPLG